jgi:hypothetical protein
MRAAQETTQDQSEPESARADRLERRIKLWVALLGLMTAIATALTAGLGLTAKKANDATTQVDASARQIKSLTDANAGLQRQLNEAQKTINGLQSPSAGSEPSPSVTVSDDVNSGATPVDLGDSRQSLLATVNGFGTANQLAINAKTFVYGLSGCKISCVSATSDFNLRRSFSVLTARLGVLDTSRAGGSAHIQLIADGVVIESKTVQLGSSYDIRLPVKNVLRLQFVESNDAGVIAAVGDPTVAP